MDGFGRPNLRAPGKWTLWNLANKKHWLQVWLLGDSEESVSRLDMVQLDELSRSLSSAIGVFEEGESADTDRRASKRPRLY